MGESIVDANSVGITFLCAADVVPIAWRVFFSGAVVGADDAGYEAVAHNVAVVEFHHGDAFYVAEDVGGLHEAAALVAGEVDLCYVACDDEFGVLAPAAEENLQL